jgi:hypothetical protein
VSDGGEPAEGRVRRGRTFLAGAVGLALLATLPFVFRDLAGDRPPLETGTAPLSPSPGASRDASELTFHGRLVYTTFETEGALGQRLVVVDLGTNAVTVGPLVPSAEELVAAGAGRGAILLVTHAAGSRRVAYLVEDPSSGSPPREVASGDVLSLSTDGTTLLVGRTRRTGAGEAGCEPHAYTLQRVDLASGRERFLSGGRVPCGNLVSATLDRDLLVASFVLDGRVEVRAIWPQNPTVLFRDLAHVSVSPRGTLLFVDPEGDVSRAAGGPPTGRVLVWPGSGTPRPLVNGVRLFAHRVLAWSPDGGHVVVNGIAGRERGMWLVYLPAGTIEPLLPSSSLPRGFAFSGATFDDAGTVFAASSGTVVAATETSFVPLELPPDAPSPVGPVAWLP